MEEQNKWLDIIAKLYKELHMSKGAMKGMKDNDKKRDRILNYFERLEEVHEKVAKSKRENDVKILKKFYYDLYIIKKENIPDSYFETQRRIMKERGYGDIEITPDRKNMLINQIIEDQKKSIDPWIEYFLFDEEAKSYEIWEKYWVFEGLQKLGKYNKETLTFSKRDKSTLYPFPPVDKQAIFETIKLMEEYIKNKTTDDEIKQALGTGNFKALYEYSIKQIMNKKVSGKSNKTEGKWIKYEQGSDYNKLRDSLQTYYTGWCTAAGGNFAKNQLENGDFYVYYSLDEKGDAKVPRIAIRMEGKNKIGEIRGIADNQNMEPEMIPILEEKLKEFPDRDKYLKKEKDMKMLTIIDNKVNKNEELTKEELMFLYEIEEKIEGFGWQKDPRIDEIRSKRNIKKDVATIYNVEENEVALRKEEINKETKLYMRSLSLNWLESSENLILPEKIKGSLSLDGLKTAEGLVLPKEIDGSLSLNGLKTANDLVLPEKINGDLVLNVLKTAKGLVLPKEIDGSLYLDGLETANDLVLPEKINGSLFLKGLKTANDLVLPEKINGSLFLKGLKTAEGLVFPKEIDGNLFLNGLETANDLVLPEKINGRLYLNGLEAANDLVLPKEIDGSLDLDGLKTAEGLVLPKEIDGSLYLDGLKTAKGLVLSEKIRGRLSLNGLKTAEGLVLPKEIDGNLFLNGLETAEGLVLPEKINGDLSLIGLKTAEGLVLPKEIDGCLDLDGLKTAEGLVLPEKINGELSLIGLKTAEGLVLPKEIDGSLYLCGLETAEGLVLPNGFNLNLLLCNNNIKLEIKNNPEIYFRESLDTEENKKVR